MPLIFIYITNPNKTVARKIAFYLIKKKLAACANIYSNVNSIYPWKGKTADETEAMLIVKTHSSKYNEIVKQVERIHPYTAPCILGMPAKANKKYEKWLKSCLK